MTEVIQQTSSPDAEAFRPEDQQDADGDITLSVGDEPQSMSSIFAFLTAIQYLSQRTPVNELSDPGPHLQSSKL